MKTEQEIHKLAVKFAKETDIRWNTEAKTHSYYRGYLDSQKAKQFTPEEILLLKKGLGAKRKALSENLKCNTKYNREKYIEANKVQIVKLELLMIKLESL